MGKFTVTHEINCDEETFWKIFFDKTFNEKLYREKLGFPSFDILEQRDTDSGTFRKCTGEPKMTLPGPVTKLVGSNFRYTEEGSFDKGSKTWRWKMIPSTMADKIRNEGTMRVEKVGEGKVRRIADITIEAKVFGVGGLIESSAEKQLREGWDESAVFMNRWIQDQK